MEPLDADLQELVEQNLPLVHAVARRWTRSRLDYRDRFQAGVFGLMMAVRRFDPECGAWPSYASWGITRYIRRAEKAAAKHARAEALDERELADEGDAFEAVAMLDEGDTVKAAMGRLPERERQVIFERYWSGLEQKAIGQRLGVSRARAQQLEMRALGRLRDTLAR